MFRQSKEPTITPERAAGLTDKQLVEAVERNVHDAAFHTLFSSYDANCAVLYKEAVRRGNEALYDRGYRRAEAGLDPR